jgi:hypothetical protein
MMKKTMSMTLAALLAVSTMGLGTINENTVVAAQAISFTDLNNHWAKQNVEKAVQQGYVDGYEDGTFKPDNTVTAAELIKLIVAGTKVRMGNQTAAEWYAPYVKAAIDAGILTAGQYSDKQLNEPMLRKDMALLAIRATNPAMREADKLSTDAIMDAAVRAGLIHGVGNGELAPEGTTTRAQSITIIDRIQRAQAGDKLPVDKYAVSASELKLMRTNIFSVMPEFFGGKQIEPWNMNNLTMETPDGLYKGVVEKIVAVDFGDPNDPNRNIAGDFDKLAWSVGGGKYYPIKDYPDSYGIFYMKKTESNKDTSKYGESEPTTYIYGLIGGNSVEMSKTGSLDGRANIYTPDRKLVGLIIPKHGQKTEGYLTISISAPAIPPNDSHSQWAISVVAPKIVD